MPFENANFVSGLQTSNRSLDICNRAANLLNCRNNVINEPTVILTRGQRLVLSVHPANLILASCQEACRLESGVLRQTGYATRIDDMQRPVFRDAERIAQEVAICLKVGQLSGFI